MRNELTTLFMAAMLLLTACAAEPSPTLAATPPPATQPPTPTATATPVPTPTAKPRPTIRPTPSAAPEREQVFVRVLRPTPRPRKTVPAQQPPDDAETILRRAIADPELLRLALRQPFLETPDPADVSIAINLAAMYRRDPEELRRLLEQRFIYDTGSPEQIAAAWLPTFSPRLRSITAPRRVAGRTVKIAVVAFDAPNPAIIDHAAQSLETAVALTGRPRRDRVIIMTAPIENGAQGVNRGDHIRISPRWPIRRTAATTPCWPTKSCISGLGATTR